MKRKQKDILVLGFLILLLLVLNYSFLDDQLSEFLSVRETVHIDRIIDGDTVEAEYQESKTSIRLLGINTPERGERLYEEASKFLESRVLNETVELEFGKDKTDRYGRLLAYIYINRTNVNLQLVENGFANFYFPAGKDRYYETFVYAWESCIEKNVNLCEKSINICSQCVQLKDFDYANDKIVLKNVCDVSCGLKGWEIKDEGRKKFVFSEFSLQPGKEILIEVGNGTDNNEKLFWRGESYVFTKTGDTIFLRDDFGKLVLWENY